MKVKFDSLHWINAALVSIVVLGTFLPERLAAQVDKWPTAIYFNQRVNYDHAIDPFLGFHVRFAFDHWNASGAKFVWAFQSPTSTIPGKAMVTMGYVISPTWLAQTTPYYYAGTHFIAKAEVVISFPRYQNDDFDSSFNTFPDPTKYDLESAIHHEAGHAAGLQHSVNASDVMYPSLMLGQRKRYPLSGDIFQLFILYP